jgi:phage shock protein A
MKARIMELEEKIKEVRARMPAHSVKPEMVQMLEDLEEELDRLKTGEAAKILDSDDGASN